MAGACDLVQADRNGEELDKETFRDAIAMCHDLTIYTSFFEPKLLELSQQFVADWAEQASQDKGLADYVQSAVQLMEKEMERCEHFNLDSTTRRDLLALLEDHLVHRQEARLTNQDEVADLLDENSVSDLEQLYKLLERRRLGAKLRPAFEKWIDLTGTAIVFDDKEQENMVVKLLTLKKQLDTIWRVSFHRNSDLGHGLREAFEAFINKSKKTTATWNTDNSKPGEMIAKYVDMLLRGGAKAIPTQLTRKAEKPATVDAEEDNEDVVFDEDTEVNNQLDQVLDLFRFVHGKAVFEAFYKKDLARRLLMGRSASADAERSMLSRLKTGKIPLSTPQCSLYSNTRQNVVPASLPILNRCSKTSSSRAKKCHLTKPSSPNDSKSNPSILPSTCSLPLLGQPIPQSLSSSHPKSNPPSTNSKTTTRPNTQAASWTGNTPWPIVKSNLILTSFRSFHLLK